MIFDLFYRVVVGSRCIDVIAGLGDLSAKLYNTKIGLLTEL